MVVLQGREWLSSSRLPRDRASKAAAGSLSSCLSWRTAGSGTTGSLRQDIICMSVIVPSGRVDQDGVCVSGERGGGCARVCVRRIFTEGFAWSTSILSSLCSSVSCQHSFSVQKLTDGESSCSYSLLPHTRSLAWAWGLGLGYGTGVWAWGVGAGRRGGG